MSYKDLKFTLAVQVTVEDYESAVALMAQYNLSWEEFGEAVHQAGINGALEGKGNMDTMYVYKTPTGKGHWFDVKIESPLFVEMKETIRFEITQPQSVRVEDV